MLLTIVIAVIISSLVTIIITLIATKISANAFAAYLAQTEDRFDKKIRHAEKTTKAPSWRMTFNLVHSLCQQGTDFFVNVHSLQPIDQRLVPYQFPNRQDSNNRFALPNRSDLGPMHQEYHLD